MTAVLSTPVSLLPGITARGAAESYTDALWAPLVAIDERVGALEASVDDLAEADSEALDLLGDWCSEVRGGLGDAEYRRLIAGRRVALERTVEPHAVWRAWEGLTKLWGGSASEAPSEVTLVARVGYLPGSAWVGRVAQVVRDCVAAGTSVYGLMAQPGCFVWDTNSFDDAGFGFDFGV